MEGRTQFLYYIKYPLERLFHSSTSVRSNGRRNLVFPVGITLSEKNDVRILQ